MCRICGERKNQSGLVDCRHYGIDNRWEAQLRPHVNKIAVIDDLANRTHDCELLIDANLQFGGFRRYDGLVPPHCIRLRSIQSTRCFAGNSLRNALHCGPDGQVRRILVFFGGMDRSNETYKALQAIASLHRDEVETNAVVGATNPHKEEVREFCVAHPGFHYYCQTDGMAKLMAAADLAIGAWRHIHLGTLRIRVAVDYHHSG